MSKPTLGLISTASVLLLCACAAPPAPTSTPLQPEGASSIVAKPGWATQGFAVAAANPLATQAGYEILQAGGSAVDAAIAVQMVLTLVEPQSSGIGGGAFLLHFDGQRTQAFDGRETAPAGATPDLLLGKDGKPLPFKQAVVGGRAVGVPGVLPMLALAHKQHGRLPWARLFESAIALSTHGFMVSERMATLLANEEHLKKDAVSAAYFYDAVSKPWPVGHILKNPELAAILQALAQQGSDALMAGEVANAIVHKVQSHPSNPGSLSAQDFASYQAVERNPLCFDYRRFSICGMPPPSSGTIAIGQILGILNALPTTESALQNGMPNAQWLHRYAEASRLAFADRAQYVADPAFVQAPAANWGSLLTDDYLQERSKLIALHASAAPMTRASAGKPDGVKTSYAPMPDQPEYGTSHISVVDRFGNAVAMTTSIEDVWGARQMVNRGKGLVGGFLLNNQLTDFSFNPTGADGLPVANRVEQGKRPRSSMSPTLVFEKATGQLLMSAGSPGGPLIIHFTAKTLLGVLDWGLNAQEAIDLPNFGSLGGAILLEEKRFDRATVQALQGRGHTVTEVALPSGLQAIERTSVGYFGGADPRREGVVMGD